MFNSIRKTIANFIAPNTIIIPAGTKNLGLPPAPKHIVEQRPNVTPYTGKFHVSQLQSLNSNYLRNAISQLGAWTALKDAFAEYDRVYGKKREAQTKLNTLVETFHAWNDGATDDREMQEDAIIETIQKLVTPKPKKSNKVALEIIAEVKGISVEQLKKQRKDADEAIANRRKEIYKGFCALVLNTPNGTDMDPSLPNAYVASKAIQTTDWIAGRDWSDDYIAAELLLIKSDLKQIEHAAHIENLKTGAGYAEAEIAPRTFGDTAEREDKQVALNPVMNTEDHEAFLAWQAEQHAA